MAQKSDGEVQGEGSTLKLGPNLVCRDHEFVRTPNGAECKKCPLGYPLTPGTTIKDGHLHIHGELVV